MSATYDPTLPTNRDHVRFLIQDTVVASALLQDEEIDAVLAAETATGAALPYFAAARCLSTLMVRWGSAGKGIMEKEVSKLRIKYGQEIGSADSVERLIKDLRERGAMLLQRPRGHTFRAL